MKNIAEKIHIKNRSRQQLFFTQIKEVQPMVLKFRRTFAFGTIHMKYGYYSYQTSASEGAL